MKKTLTSIIFVLSFGAYVAYSNSTSSTTTASTETSSLVVTSPSTATTSEQTPSTPQQQNDSSQPQNTIPTPVATTKKGTYTDGTFTGDAEDAFYGTVQVSVTIQNGALTKVTFLQYPHEQGTSAQINARATAALQQEAIAAQSANINGVTGATHTVEAFKLSLASALSKAS